MGSVLIKTGFYGKKTIINQSFEMSKTYDQARGYVEVYGDERLLGSEKPRRCRVRVKSEDDIMYSDEPVKTVSSAIEEYKEIETEEQALLRIKKTFDNLDMFADAAAEGTIRGLIVVGEPGIGKSFGVEEVLNKANIFNTISGKDDMFEIIKGAISPPFLYRKLYEFRHSDKVLVLDDCEIEDVEAINMLKAALDSCSKRFISWYKESNWLDKEGIPNRFEFSGSVICLTNADIAGRKGRLGEHLNAVVSRCHYLDLEINTTKDKVLRIKQVIKDGMLDKYDFDDDTKKKIVSYVEENCNLFREVSLRTVRKLSDLIKAFPEKWEEAAEISLMIPSAKYERMKTRIEAKCKQ